MNWKSFIQLDQRSSVSPADQLSMSLIELIKEDLILRPGFYLDEDELTHQLKLDIPTVKGVFKNLHKIGILDKQNERYLVSAKSFIYYHFPRPFAQKSSLESRNYEEVLISETTKKLPKIIQDFFHIQPVLATCTYHQFKEGLKTIATSETYEVKYVNVHEEIFLSQVQQLFSKPGDEYIRFISVIEANPNLLKDFSLEEKQKFFLQGVYALKQENGVFRFGIVTTLTHLNYRQKLDQEIIKNLF